MLIGEGYVLQSDFMDLERLCSAASYKYCKPSTEGGEEMAWSMGRGWGRKNGEGMAEGKGKGRVPVVVGSGGIIAHVHFAKEAAEPGFIQAHDL